MGGTRRNLVLPPALVESFFRGAITAIKDEVSRVRIRIWGIRDTISILPQCTGAQPPSPPSPSRYSSLVMLEAIAVSPNVVFPSMMARCGFVCSAPYSIIWSCTGGGDSFVARLDHLTIDHAYGQRCNQILIWHAVVIYMTTDHACRPGGV